MKAKKGEWFSLDWEIIDFYDPLSFEQFEKSPSFLYAEEDSNQIESEIINKLDRLRLTSIFMTNVFVTSQHGIKVPTHYQIGKFMPGDNPSYDKWLADYHKINFEITEYVRDKEALNQKNIYLEHAAKIIRHDMHSGINTYIPRGFKGLLRRLPKDAIDKYRLDTSIKLLSEGIDHAQRVYQGVYAFTNLVKQDSILEKEECDLKEILLEYLGGTAYSDQVVIEDLITINVNKSLFCTAVDNLIRNGLKYNDSETKWVKIYMDPEDDDTICIQDNGRGLTKKEFIDYCRPYVRKEGQEESGSGLGLNIAAAIFDEHNFRMEPQKLEIGTIMRIDLDANDKKYIIGG
jgi:signal transduction histidine kinase